MTTDKDTRPSRCRFRLRDEGKPYPRSSCEGCGRTIVTGLGNDCQTARQDAAGAITDKDTEALIERLDDLSPDESIGAYGGSGQWVEFCTVREARRILSALTAGEPAQVPSGWRFKIGDRVTKTKGSSWTGHIVGFYSTSLTPVGYAVESENEPGSVQIYPEAALTAAPTAGGGDD